MLLLKQRTSLGHICCLCRLNYIKEWCVWKLLLADNNLSGQAVFLSFYCILSFFLQLFCGHFKIICMHSLDRQLLWSAYFMWI